MNGYLPIFTLFEAGLLSLFSGLDPPYPGRAKLVQGFASGRRRSSAHKGIVGTLTEVRTFGGASTANCKLAVKCGHLPDDSANSRGEARFDWPHMNSVQ